MTRLISKIIAIDYETADAASKNNQGAAKAIEFSAIEISPDFQEIPGGRHHKIIGLNPSVVPNVEAYGITGIDPIASEKVAMTEFDFADFVSKLYLSQPNTAIMGYNSIAFDDEVTRHTLYRNLLSPYEHEFSKGNFRIDVYKAIQLAYAMAPNVINWPRKEDGTVSLRLEDLTRVNGISHEHAHSAESDVLATIALAKMLSEANPKLWAHALNCTDKNYTSDLMYQSDMFFHVERFYGKENRYTKVMAVGAPNPEIPSQIICVDLNSPDFDEMLGLSPEQIRERRFKKLEDQDNGILGLQNIATNKMPMVVKATPHLLDHYKDQFNLDLERINRNLRTLQNTPEFKRVLQESVVSERDVPKAYAHQLYFMPSFPSRETKKILAEMHRKDRDGNPRIMTTSIAELASKTDDPERYYDLALMAKWDNFYRYFLSPGNHSSIDKVEFVDWVDRLQDKLERGWDGTQTLDEFDKNFTRYMKESVLSEEKMIVLNNLRYVVDDKRKLLEGLQQTAEEMRPEAEAERANRRDYKAFYASVNRRGAPQLGY